MCLTLQVESAPGTTHCTFPTCSASTFVSQIVIWDVQLWSVFTIRFNKRQTGGEEAFNSLGALGHGVLAHNATNDCVAQLLSLLKIMSMSETEWESWFSQKTNLQPMAMSWVDKAVYEHNFAMRPRSLYAAGPTHTSHGRRQANNNQAACHRHHTPKHVGTPAATSSASKTAATAQMACPTSSIKEVTTIPSPSVQRIAKPLTTTKMAVEVKEQKCSYSQAAQGLKAPGTKANENVASGNKVDESVDFFARYDAKKVRDVMSKYRKPQ